MMENWDPQPSDVDNPVNPPEILESQALKELDAIEDKLVEAMEIAAQAMDHIADKEGKQDIQEFGRLSTSFLELIKEIHTKLTEKSSLLTNYHPYGRSVYETQRDKKISAENARVILSHLRGISNALKIANQESETNTIT